MTFSTTLPTAAFVGVAFCGICFAQSTSPTPRTPAADAQQKGTESVRAPATVLTGRVTSVDAKAGTLTVKTKDREITLTTASPTTKTALGKLKVGDTARVFERGGSVIAVSAVGTESGTKAPK
jgi:hypothetical protein